jgi:transposase InsO family protein
MDHFNDRIVAWHVAQRGDRLAALEPVRQGVREHFGDVGLDMTRGLQLRMDRRLQYMVRDFRNGVRFLRMEAAPAFVGEPQGNGVAERVIGLVKEPGIWGQRLCTLDEAGERIGAFIARYNAHWLTERLGLRSPVEGRLLAQVEAALC